MPITPMEVSASLTSSSLNGLMIASIFFIRDPPGRVHSNRRARGCAGQTPTKSGDSTRREAAEPPVRLRLDAPDVPAVLGAIALQERGDQDRDMLPALAQRRDVDRDGVDPEEQVLAQATLAQGGLGAPVRRRDEAEVHRD